MRAEVLNQLGRRTLIMGILNVTPDSFSDGGRYLDLKAALARARRLVEEGADIIDIGGESTRPGADPVPLAEELRRAIPVVEAVREEFPEVCLSIDTYKARVAEEALRSGADLINDVSALRFDPEMASVAAEYDVPVVLMHMKGTPKTMQQDPRYSNVMGEILAFLNERIEWAVSQGISYEKIIIDPGIGFGKRPEHNTEILRRLGELRSLGRPILLGTSRKSFLGALSGRPVEERLEETIASVVIGVLNGADIVRVHDVRAVRYALTVADAIRYTHFQAEVGP